MSVHISADAQNSEEDIRFPGGGITSGYKPPDVRAENQTTQQEQQVPSYQHLQMQPACI